MAKSSWQRKREEAARIAGLEAENWNLKHPIGTAVVLKKAAATRMNLPVSVPQQESEER